MMSDPTSGGARNPLDRAEVLRDFSFEKFRHEEAALAEAQRACAAAEGSYQVADARYQRHVSSPAISDKEWVFMGSNGEESEEYSLVELLSLVGRVPTLRINNADRGLSLRLVDAINNHPEFLKSAHERRAASGALQEVKRRVAAAQHRVRGWRAGVSSRESGLRFGYRVDAL